MKRLTRWTLVSLFRLGRLRFGGVFLAGAMLLTLALAVPGLILPTSAASAAPFRPPPRPTATPTQPRSTPTPRPTATTAPGPTATATARAATSTAHPGANTNGTDAAGSTQSQSTDSLLWSSLLWGLGAVVIALLGFGAFIWLFTRRAARERQQQPAFSDYARTPSRERLNQLYQSLPSRTVPPSPPTEEEREAATTLAEEDTSQPWSPPSGVSWPPSPKPPQWLTEAGLLKNSPLKDSTKEHPPEAPEEP